MYNLKRWMIGLDFTPYDKHVIRYASFLSGIAKPDKAYFIHFKKNIDVPDEIRKAYADAYLPPDELIKEEMKTLAQGNFPGIEKLDVEYDFIEGDPLELVRWAQLKNTDLVVAGKKRLEEGGGELAQKLARKGMSSILFVTPEAKPMMETLFVTLDFSEYSRMALEEAWSLAEKNPKSKIICYHAYQLPTGYYKTGKTEEEFAEIMRSHAESKFKELMAELKIPPDRVSPLFELESGVSTAVMINRAAHSQKADIIIIGAKGRTSAIATLLGSVTEKLMKVDSDIPLLVVKSKEKSFNFIEFLKNI